MSPVTSRAVSLQIVSMRSARRLRELLPLHLHHLHHPQRLHHRSAGIIGAPFSKGQPQEGVDQGPDLIRASGLISKLQQQGCAVKDYGNLQFAEVEDAAPVGGAKNSAAVGRANQKLSEAVRRVKEEGHTALVLGGDHSLALGSVHGHHSSVGRLSLVWVDAHADVNTPLSSSSGNLHGQTLAFLLHQLSHQVPVLQDFSWARPCVSAKDLVYIGLRDLDPGEISLLQVLGVQVFSMEQIDRLGIYRVMEETCDYLTRRGQRPVHLSFDIDALDPSVAAATGTPVAGGLTVREGLVICEHLSQTGLLSAVDLVEVNPLRGRSQRDVIDTAGAAVQMLLAAFGRPRLGSYPPQP